MGTMASQNSHGSFSPDSEDEASVLDGTTEVDFDGISPCLGSPFKALFTIELLVDLWRDDTTDELEDLCRADNDVSLDEYLLLEYRSWLLNSSVAVNLDRSEGVDGAGSGNQIPINFKNLDTALVNIKHPDLQRSLI